VAVKIRLKRMGKIRQPYYRVVVVDSRQKRDGKVIEEIGKYHPKEEPSFIEVTSERAQYWLGVGAQPSEAVEAIFKVTGDWQKFKGLPGAEGTLKTAEPKRDKTEIFNEALKDAANEPKSEAVTKKATKKAAAEDKPAIEPKAEKAPKSEEPKAEKADEPAAVKADEPAADAPAEAPATTDEARARCWPRRSSTGSVGGSTTPTTSPSVTRSCAAVRSSRCGSTPPTSAR
jgi:small subunit ribosomal protein S16